MHIDTQFAREAIRPRSLLERLLACDEGTLGMGTINEGIVNKGVLAGSSDGILGIHKQASTRDNA